MSVLGNAHRQIAGDADVERRILPARQDVNGVGALLFVKALRHVGMTVAPKWLSSTHSLRGSRVQPVPAPKKDRRNRSDYDTEEKRHRRQQKWRGIFLAIC
jgi:hypothetical protein